MIEGAKEGDLVLCIDNMTHLHKDVARKMMYLTKGKVYTVFKDQSKDGMGFQLYITNDIDNPEWFTNDRFIKVDNEEQAEMLRLIYA